MAKGFLEAMQAMARDRDFLVSAANRCDKAYSEGAGFDYKPFTANEHEKVAQNYAGLQAVMSGVPYIAVLRDLDIREDGVGISILHAIVNNEVSSLERDTLHRFANCSWGTCQPFRMDKGPLGRADRVNMFDLLPKEEVDKDWVQIQAAAKCFLEVLS